jgi:hypothetical protein
MGTALIALAPTARPTPIGPAARPHCARFLAHLIATTRQAPQTRARRRAAPHQATAAYDAAKRQHPAIGSLFAQDA